MIRKVLFVMSMLILIAAPAWWLCGCAIGLLLFLGVGLQSTRSQASVDHDRGQVAPVDGKDAP